VFFLAFLVAVTPQKERTFDFKESLVRSLTCAAMYAIAYGFLNLYGTLA
jgi:hypothetical protein